jgi:hypothetical protein
MGGTMAYKIQHLGLGGILDQTIAITKDHFGLLFSIVLILIVPCELLIGFIDLANSPELLPDATLIEQFEAEENFEPNPRLTLLSLILEFLVYFQILLPLTNASIIHAVARVYLGEPVTALDAIMHALRRFLPLIGTTILIYIAVVGGLILLIIPGILFALWFSLSQHVVMIEGLAGAAALRRSKFLARKHLGTMLILGFIVLLISMALFVCTDLIQQPHLYVISVALAEGILAIPWTASGVVFYFSCRCAEENFDLEYLAQSIHTDDPLDEQTLTSRGEVQA